MRRLTLLLAVTIGLTGLAGPAFAAFNVCNKSNLPVRAAIGRFDGSYWASEGWWTIDPKACISLLTGPLQGRFYYLYASDGANGSWGGKHGFCVGPAKFSVMGRGSCAARGFERKRFFEVDTGNAPDYTHTLSD
jgi:uncharacterized membrane protein